MARNLPETAPENPARMRKLFPAAEADGASSITKFIPTHIGYRLEGGIAHFTPDVPGMNSTPYGEQIEGRFDDSPGPRGTSDSGWNLKQTTSPTDLAEDHLGDIVRGNSQAGGTEHAGDPDELGVLLGLIDQAVQ